MRGKLKEQRQKKCVVNLRFIQCTSRTLWCFISFSFSSFYTVAPSVERTALQGALSNFAMLLIN